MAELFLRVRTKASRHHQVPFVCVSTTTIVSEVRISAPLFLTREKALVHFNLAGNPAPGGDQAERQGETKI